MKNQNQSKSTLASRLGNSRGRFVGVTTANSGGVRKFVGRIQSVSTRYVTMEDRNRGQVKFAIGSVTAVRGV